jgi:hypothetical protein
MSEILGSEILALQIVGSGRENGTWVPPLYAVFCILSRSWSNNSTKLRSWLEFLLGKWARSHFYDRVEGVGRGIDFY